ASGRVIEAETGKPVPGVMIGYNVVKETAAGFNMSMANSATNSAGEFRLEGLSPNSYRVFVMNVGASDLYASDLNFKITGGDVVGLEIKMSQGASISGVAVVEGTGDPAILAGLSKIQLRAVGDSKDRMMMMMSGGSGTINANGSFRIGGVRPGKTRIMASTVMSPKGLSLIRIEQNSNEVKQLEILPGDQVTGVRLVFTYGTGVIDGNVKTKGGTLQPNQRLYVIAVREGDSPDDFMNVKRAPVDLQNKFQIEGLSQGSYKLRLEALVMIEGGDVKSTKTEKTVPISGNAKQGVTLELDPTKKEEDK